MSACFDELIDRDRANVLSDAAEIVERRRTRGCLDMAQMGKLVKSPEDIPDQLRRHIDGCDWCREQYQSFLEGFPELPRPAWLSEAEVRPTSSALVKRQTTALARKKDVAKTNFRPWYLDHEGNDIRPWYMRWLDNLKDLPGDIFHTDREHRH